jgi:hypothetical protein
MIAASERPAAAVAVANPARSECRRSRPQGQPRRREPPRSPPAPDPIRSARDCRADRFAERRAPRLSPQPPASGAARRPDMSLLLLQRGLPRSRRRLPSRFSSDGSSARPPRARSRGPRPQARRARVIGRAVVHGDRRELACDRRRPTTPPGEVRDAQRHGLRLGRQPLTPDPSGKGAEVTPVGRRTHVRLRGLGGCAGRGVQPLDRRLEPCVTKIERGAGHIVTRDNHPTER